MASPGYRSAPRSPATTPGKSGRGCQSSACLGPPRVDRAARGALAEFFAAVELVEEGRKVAHEALELHLRAMHEMVAVRAIPLECVHGAIRPRHLNHQSNGVCLALRRMAHVLRQKKHLALPDGNVSRWLARFFHDAQKDVALELIEKFLRRVVMEVASLVRSADNCDHELAIFPNLGIADGRLEFVAVF